MNGSTVVHPYRGILLSNEKDQTTDGYNNLDEPPEKYAERGKKANLIYDYIYIIFLKGQNYRDGDQITGCRGLKMRDGVGEECTALPCTLFCNFLWL